ncbi:MAG TPA: hypothetical protein EYO31_04320, partial [Phycisphaerales bacterium]|nr:hypothetical protein [Phycisphaerales bacterium]
MELDAQDSGKHLSVQFKVKRHEKSAHVDSTSPEVYLAPERNVPNTKQFLDIATKVLIDKNGGDLVKARA